jgi:ABC-type microcin C transport system duplicated ATPase subunit YejF
MSANPQMQPESPPEPLLRVEHLKKWFPVKRGILARTVGHVKAVDDVSFDIAHNETLGLVGESGCGKTTVGRTILRLIEPTEGRAFFRGTELFELGQTELRKMRRAMQIIFQDPYSSLNPRMTVESLVGDSLEVYGIATGDDCRQQVQELLRRVGLQPEALNRYPHEFSGGQRQRIGIARALALRPATRPSARSTSRFRPRSSTCCRTFSRSTACRFCSLPTTCRWSDTSRTGSR